MTVVDRAAAYVRSCPKWPASWPHIVQEAGGPVFYATWLMGQNYQATSKYYGAYPPRYLERMSLFFPDVLASRSSTLHVFAGSLPCSSAYTRLDVRPELTPDICASVYDAAAHCRESFPLIYADPPYSEADAEKYGTPMVDRRRVMASLALVSPPGGHLVWLDTTWPIHQKVQWRTIGRIALIRSTNHRVRLVSVFERQAA